MSIETRTERRVFVRADKLLPGEVLLSSEKTHRTEMYAGRGDAWEVLSVTPASSRSVFVRLKLRARPSVKVSVQYLNSEQVELFPHVGEPGEFSATCSEPGWVPLDSPGVQLIDGLGPSKRIRGVWHRPIVCDAIEFTSRAAFAAHRREVHGVSSMRRTAAPTRGPGRLQLTEEGRLFAPKGLAVGATVSWEDPLISVERNGTSWEHAPETHRRTRTGQIWSLGPTRGYYGSRVTAWVIPDEPSKIENESAVLLSFASTKDLAAPVPIDRALTGGKLFGRW